MFAPELRDKAVIADMPQRVIVLRASGGGSTGPGARSRLRWTNTRLDIFCYGKTPAEAFELYALVEETLRDMDQRRSPLVNKVDTVVKDAIVSGGPIQQRDLDTDWPYVMGVFDVAATPAS